VRGRGGDAAAGARSLAFASARVSATCAAARGPVPPPLLRRGAGPRGTPVAVAFGAEEGGCASLSRGVAALGGDLRSSLRGEGILLSLRGEGSLQRGAAARPASHPAPAERAA